MSIYSTQICFVYKWIQLSTGKWYIGSRTAKNCHPGDGYICSSKIVKPIIQSNPEDWTREILEIGSKDAILLLEHELLKCLNAAQSEYSYNKTNGAGTFSNSGRKCSEELRSIRSVNANNMSKEHKQKISIANTGKTRKFTEAHKQKLSIANTNIIFSDERKYNMSISHKGKILSEEHKTKISNSNKNTPKILCPYCNKIGDIGNIKRWHLDNCKYKN